MDAACHSHSINGKAFSTLGQNIKITTQDSCSFYSRCSLYENFGGVVLADEEGDNIAKALGPDNIAMIMQNHGILTCGTTIEAAVSRFIALERHCEVMLRTQAAGNPVEIGKEEAEFTWKQASVCRVLLLVRFSNQIAFIQLMKSSRLYLLFTFSDWN